MRRGIRSAVLALAFLAACSDETGDDAIASRDEPAATSDEAVAAWLGDFHRLRDELIEASRPCERALLAWHRAKGEEAVRAALSDCRKEAEALLPFLSTQLQAVKDAEVPEPWRALHEAHSVCLEFGHRGVLGFLDMARAAGGATLDRSVFSPTGLPGSQRQLHVELQTLLGGRQTEEELAAAERIRQEVARSRTIDEPLKAALRGWREAKDPRARRDSALAQARALKDMEPQLLKQYADLSKLAVPARHRDLLAALRGVVLLEILVCRRLPEAFLRGDRSMGMWTSVLNEVMNPKAEMAGVNPFDEARGETEDR